MNGPRIAPKPKEEGTPIARIRMLRERSGLTQSDFARACGISRAYISLIESGVRRDIGISKLAAISITSGASLDFIVLGRGEMPSVSDVGKAVQLALTDRDLWRAEIAKALGTSRRKGARAKPLPRRALPAAEARS